MINYIRTIVKKIFQYRILVKVIFRNGQSFKCWLTRIEYEKENGMISRLVWERYHLMPDPFFYISVADITNIQIVKRRGFMHE